MTMHVTRPQPLGQRDSFRAVRRVILLVNVALIHKLGEMSSNDVFQIFNQCVGSCVRRPGARCLGGLLWRNRKEFACIRAAFVLETSNRQRAGSWPE